MSAGDGPAGEFRLFSLRRLHALAASTLTQLLRMRTLYFLLLFGGLLVVFGFILPTPQMGEGMASFGGEQELRLLKSVSLGAMSWFCILLAIAGTAVLLPRDFEDRTLYTILSKPVPRYEYLMGKLLGVLLLLCLCLALMDAACSGMLWLKQKMLMSQEIAYWEHKHGRALTAEEMRQVTGIYTRYGLDAAFQAAVAGIFFQAAIMASVTLFISTFATSSLFTILTGISIFVIGQGQELAREYIFKDMAAVLQKSAAIVLALVFPDLRQFNIVDEVVSGTAVPAEILWKMAGLAGLYLLFYNVVAWLVFAEREL